MRRVLLLVVTATLAGVVSLSRAPELAAQSPAPRIGTVELSTVAEWQTGTRDGLLVSNNQDGELRLVEDRPQGVFDSGLIKAEFPFNALGAVWRAEAPAGTSLDLEVRGGPTAEQLSDWQPLVAGDARSQSDDGALTIESVRPFPAGSAFLELRATFNTTVANASPVISEINLSYISASVGPARPDGLPRVPATSGAATLTEPPRIIQRSNWYSAPNVQIARQTPHGILLHQIGVDNLAEPLPFMRALVAFDTQVLGWDDVPFHFIIDGEGTIYEGHVGGPTAAVPRLAGGDAAIQIALIGSTGAPEAQQTALSGLLAWLGQAYRIPPLGQHAVAQASGSPVNRPNIAAHADVVPEAADPSAELRSIMGTLRQRADQATVRARWYFAEGNVQDYTERLAVLNPSANPASVTYRLLRQPGPQIQSTVTISGGGRDNLVVNNLFNDTTDVPAIIESNAPVIAERFMDFTSDITAGPGIRRPSRVWYFAEGATTTNNRTFLLLFNPQSVEVATTVTYMKGDGTTAAQQVRIPPGRRTVVTVGDALPNAEFGARVIASEPIVAERTMIFGPGSSLTSGGVHSGPGVVTLSRRWFFAEGTTQAPFQMSVLVLNPNAQPANVAVTFLTPDGTSLTRRYAIPPTSRLAINVNEVVPDLGVATTVEADRPVAAERAMYWRDNSVGTASAGATATAFTWRFADGRTSGEFQEYLLLSNPNKNQARVAVEFILNDGTTANQVFPMPGGSRYTLAVHQLYPGQEAISATVSSTQPIVAERSLFPGDPRAANNRGGATALGVPEGER
ncbi:MAG TPA: peptidoglycan recognition family protein [Roseiflexaceae bacterium]|nr:peptidoglycan recognition family protein [Roseiflexaceae bacterium]